MAGHKKLAQQENTSNFSVKRQATWGTSDKAGKMAGRLVVIFLPEVKAGRLEKLLPLHSRRYWRETVPAGQEKFSWIVQQRHTERFFSRDRNSTDELYDDIDESLRLRPSYLLTVETDTSVFAI